MTNQGTPVSLSESVLLSDNERALVRRIADAEGISEEEAASNIISAGLAKRVKKRTGKTPAKIYTLGNK